MKTIEPEPQAPEILVEDEPRYLRRQKPLEIKRRKFGRRAWKLYAQVALAFVGTIALIWGIYAGVDFLFYSTRFALPGVDGIELAGNHFVSRAAVLEKFTGDAGRSILRIPLGARRAALEEIPWVEQASVRRVLPNQIRVELVERIPVAFLRLSTELALIDAYGVILERPAQADFKFPVVTGLSEVMSLDDRAQRMQRFLAFMKDVEGQRSGAAEQVSEVDLAEPSDLRATLAGMRELGNPAADGQESVLVHFGAGDFGGKYRTLIDNIAQWRAAAGRVESIDLRFERQVVVNPETQPGPAANADRSKEVRR